MLKTSLKALAASFLPSLVVLLILRHHLLPFLRAGGWREEVASTVSFHASRHALPRQLAVARALASPGIHTPLVMAHSLVKDMDLGWSSQLAVRPRRSM